MKFLTAILLLALLSCAKPTLKVAASKSTLLANGYDTAILKIYGSIDQPRLEFSGDRHFARLIAAHRNDNYWEAELAAGVMPGVVQVRVTSQGQQAGQNITLEPQTTDSASDGTPDFLRLEDAFDIQTFRSWITYLAEAQYFTPRAARAPEISDCSALVRYAYSEALRNHDAVWLAGVHLPVIPALSSIRKYSYPHTLLGPNIFRIRGGTYSPLDLTNGTFAEFADAKTLQQFNLYFVSRDVTRALPGDILFYRRQTGSGLSYHSMIFLGPSQLKPDGEIYVVYHTGPDGTSNGEIRRLNLTQLLHFPNAQWQAIAANRLFLGVYRWNILKASS